MNQAGPERAADVAPSDRCLEMDGRPQSSWEALRRRAARGFALTAILAMVISAVPAPWHWLGNTKRILSARLIRVGLWQEGWSMFAPDPVLNNGWISAEIEHSNGTSSQWNSPYWIQSSTSDKFLRFRYLNYYNRLPSLWYHAAREDFSDYLARQSDVPVETVKLYHTRMRLLMPEDGSLPKRDEVDWMFSSEIVAKRTYKQPNAQQANSQQANSLQATSQQANSQQATSQQANSQQAGAEP